MYCYVKFLYGLDSLAPVFPKSHDWRSMPCMPSAHSFSLRFPGIAFKERSSVHYLQKFEDQIRVGVSYGVFSSSERLEIRQVGRGLLGKGCQSFYFGVFRLGCFLPDCQIFRSFLRFLIQLLLLFDFLNFIRAEVS